MSNKQLQIIDELKPGTSMDESLSKSTFESLNIVVENGKPKFRLNEPAFTTVNIPFQSNFSCDDDDNSFVVLGKSSLDFINTASLADYEQIQQKSSAVVRIIQLLITIYNYN